MKYPESHIWLVLRGEKNCGTENVKHRKNVFPFTRLLVCQRDRRSAIQKNTVFTNSNLIIYISSHVCKWLSTKQLPWKPYQVQACLKVQLA